MNPTPTPTFQHQTRKKFFIPAVLILSLVLGLGTGIWIWSQNQDTTPTNTPQAQAPATPSPSPDPAPNTNPLKDDEGSRLTAYLRTAGYEMGFIHSTDLTATNQAIPKVKTIPGTPLPSPKSPIQEIIPAPENPSKRNLLVYPAYDIQAPIQYASFEDLFGVDSSGNLNVEADPGDRNNSTQSPVQKKLEQGVAHLAFSPMPGQLGNSYIIGHSSNYSIVPSQYNTIFKPIERRSKPGEEFMIYDAYGRELVFRVFEAKAINEADVQEAYKPYPNRRVVTLQASILENVNGVNLPTKRWLTRGELQTPKPPTQNSAQT